MTVRLAPGDQAPDFNLVDDTGTEVSLGDFHGRSLVLYAYSGAMTPGCTTEACEFRDNIFAYRERNAIILGVSLDDAESHKAFAENHGLPFTLLADTEGTAAEAYGVKTRMLGMTVAKRQTFIIDPAGKIAKHYKKVDPESHSEEVLADLDLLTGRATEGS